MIIWRTTTSSLLSLSRFTERLNYWIVEYKKEIIKIFAAF